jgi:hypothetical protein
MISSHWKGGARPEEAVVAPVVQSKMVVYDKDPHHYEVVKNRMPGQRIEDGDFLYIVRNL